MFHIFGNKAAQRLWSEALWGFRTFLSIFPPFQAPTCDVTVVTHFHIASESPCRMVSGILSPSTTSLSFQISSLLLGRNDYFLPQPGETSYILVIECLVQMSKEILGPLPFSSLETWCRHEYIWDDGGGQFSPTLRINQGPLKAAFI